MYTRKYIGILMVTGLLVTGFLASCTAATPEPIPLPSLTPLPSSATPIPPTQTPVPPTATEIPTETPLPPTVTPTKTRTPMPTDTSTPTSTATEVQPTTPLLGELSYASGDQVKMYYILLNTGGTVACGDSVVAVNAGVEISGDISEDVAAGLKRLFADHSKFSGALYNPLYASNIRVEKVTFSDGLITVDLRGTYKPSGDDCDNLRVKAQVWSTARQFRGIRATNIYLNGIPFGDRVSNDK